VGENDATRARTVWIAEDRDPHEQLLLTGRFSGHLEIGEDAGEAFEDLPVDAAIGWGRERATVVLIRTGDGDYHSAGDHNPDPEQLPPWPPSGLRLERRRPRGFEAIDNTEDDPPVLWDVRIEASVSEDVDAIPFHDEVRLHPAARDPQAPAPGYPATSATFLVEAATQKQAQEIAEGIAGEAVQALLDATTEPGLERAFTYAAEVYPHRPGEPVRGPGLTF
jgi:hypothetical protein